MLKIYNYIFVAVVFVIAGCNVKTKEIGANPCDTIQVSSGKIYRFANFKSAFAQPRNVDVWVPVNYSAEKQYTVLYMHDGQMLFDSSRTWTKQEWKMDETISKLVAGNKISDCIVVGIWNSGKDRHSEYFPQKPYDAMTPEQKDYAIKQLQNLWHNTDTFKSVSDNYLKFITKELKPFIDEHFYTNSDQPHTFILGSSMGGLISLYAICEYPDVFGGAACLSTHWPGIFTVENNPIPEAINAYLQKHLPKPATHKIYFDYGNKTLDSLYPPLQKKVDEIMKTKGYTDANWTTRFFEGENHSERSWSKRMDVPVLFLIGK